MAEKKKTKKVSRSQRMKELKSNLHYHQMYMRMDMASIESRKETIRRIAAEMRALQAAK